MTSEKSLFLILCKIYDVDIQIFNLDKIKSKYNKIILGISLLRGDAIFL